VSGDIAHDLRTPLGRMRGALERALVDDAEPAARRAALESAIDQSDAVLQIFEAMLRIAEVEEGAARRGFEPVDLGALVTEVVEAFQPVADEDRRPIAAMIEPGCVAFGDRRLIGQAVVNLIENALRHTPPQTRITVGTIDRMTTVSLFVSDTGRGVPADQRDRIFQRFVRLESARSTPGHGLGLSMVAAVAAVHGATLEAQDAAPGFLVSLTFPRGRPQ
jgi:signal transduction histidine kinase